MHKSTKILSVISMIISCIAIFIAVAFLTFLWEPMCLLLYSGFAIENGPIIPIGTAVRMLGYLFISVILLATCKVKRFVAIEIIAIIAGLVLPFFSSYIVTVQNVMLGRFIGSEGLAAFSITNNLLNLPLGIMSLSLTINMITSGMRLAEKTYLRK